ncbi:MAG: hypothetical protein HYZ50_02885 [Deltaproteobacteria bacterium]|nr:hypothetical protein [Deltaproteobacteria bacterium]
MTQTVPYRANAVPWKDENLIFGAEHAIKGLMSSSAVTPSLWEVAYAPGPQVLSITETDVAISPLNQSASRAFEVVLRQVLQRSREWESKLKTAATFDQVEMDLGVEKEIVLHMPPYARKAVRVRARYTGPAKPKVVYDPPPEDEERGQE